MSYERCFCGCGKRAQTLHHAITQQEIRRNARGRDVPALLADQRNLVPVNDRCHGNHHSRARPYQLGMLPASVFDFALEVLGAGRAHGYLARHYNGMDLRLDALLLEWEREAA